MRQLIMAGMVLSMVGLVQAAENDVIKCKADGLHLCCGTCETSVRNILMKFDGISAIKIDRKAADKVTFDAADENVAKSALKALLDGGFCCEITAGANKLTPPADDSLKNVTADTFTVKNSHVCCGSCTNAIKKLFPDATITVAGMGAQKDVTITGKGLNGQTVADTLHKAGFGGMIEAKK